jgi:hypothetical protein
VLFAVPQFAAPRAARLDLAPVAYLRQHLGDQRFYTLGPIAPDYGSYFGLASLSVDDFPPKAYAGYMHRRIDPWFPFVGFRSPKAPSPESELLSHLRGYRLAAVRYVVLPASASLPQSRRTFRLVLRTPTARIYRLAGASPYFSARGCRVSSPGRASATVTCRRPSTLIRRETELPGWSAQVDGHPVTIRRAYGLFQAVPVPGGVHRVSFSFTPPGMGWAGLGVLGACALMLVPTGRLMWAKHRRGGAGRP